MKQKLSLITLGVSDLAKSKYFYSEVLGWNLANQSNDGVAFYQTENLGVIISLYLKKSLAEDVSMENNGSGFPNFSLALNLDSESEVDNLINDLRSKNVEIVKEPVKVFWGGYSAYFKDPDGFLWEVAYNPFWAKNQNGDIDLSIKPHTNNH